MTNGMSQMVDERGGSNTNRGNFEAFFDSVYGNAAAEDADFDAVFSNMYGTSAQPTPRQRVSSYEEAMARAQQPGQGEGGFWSGVGEAISEGAKGAGRAVKEGVGGLVVNTVSGLTRLAGTPVRALTGWEGLHKLANAIDESYANFGAQALESEYGANPDGFGYGAGRFGEKLTGIAGNLGGLAAPGGIAKAAKAPAAIKTAAAAVQKSFPYMFGNNAAVQAYDTARENGKSKAEATALAGLNGAIHFLGFKAFENQSLNKMLGMPKSMEAMMPKWAGEAAAAAPQTFTSLARSVRNGMIKYTLAERGKGMLKAGGIMGVQNLLSDPVMQVAEGKSLDDIDFSRTGMAGLEGLEEGALMEGLMGGAAIYKSPKAAREFIADKLYRGKDYKVIGSDGKPHDEPGLLETPQGRMALMKQNPDATERVLDIIEHGGVARPDELDAAFLPPDMSEKEQRKFAADWRKDLEPYVEEAWNADKPKDALPAPDMAAAEAPRREFISPDEARAQQKAINDAAERRRADNKAQSEVSIDDYTVWNDAYRRGVTNMSLDEWLATKAQRDATPRLRAPTLEEEADELARRAPEPDEPIKVSPMPEQKTDDSAIADNGRNPDADAYAQAQLLREQVQRRIDMEKQGEKGRKVQKELDNFSKAVRNHMDVFDNDTFGKENAELLSAVEDAIRKNNTQLVKENLNKLIKQVRKFSKRKLQNQEGENDETGNVRDEAPAQPEQGQVERPEPAAPVREEPRPVEGEPPRAEAPREEVVELPAEEGRQNLTEGRQELTPPEVESKPAEAQEPAKPAEPPKTAQEPSAEAGQGEAAPTAEKPPKAVSEAPKAEPVPERPAPTNRLRRADGTDPLVEKEEQAKKGAEATAPLSRTVRKNLVKRLSPIFDLVRNKDGSYNPDALRNHDGNGGLSLQDLKRLHEHPEVIDDLGLKPEAAAALRSAVRKAYEDGYLKYHYQSAHDKLAAYERGSGDLAFVYNAVADAAGKAKAKGDKLGESLLQPKLAELVEKVNALSEAERNMILSKAASAVNGKLTPMEKKRRASITTVEGKDIDIPTGGIGGIDGDIETQREIDKAVDRQVRSESSDAARLGRITERDDAAEGGAEKPQGVSRDGNKAGDRHIQLETKGGKKYVVWRNEFDEVVKRAPMDALRALAKASPEMKALVDKLEAGEEIRASKAAPESPEERDLRFAADENYQKWLKSRKANDAEPLRERYEQEQAKAAKSIARNTLLGVDVEIVDRAFNPETDGGVGERKSIGRLYTGSAADYEKPSLHHVGTGEGSQVYGWGLYASDQRGVAEGYAFSESSKVNPDRSLKLNGRTIDWMYWEKNVKEDDYSSYKSIANLLASNRGDVDKVISDIEPLIKNGWISKESVDWLKSNKSNVSYSGKSGNVYEQTFFTNRAPGDESHLLKWYEPVSEENLKRINDQLDEEYTDPIEGYNHTGMSVYKQLSGRLGGPKNASRFLARAGIDGIKYPVDSYGGKTVKDGDKVGWNYVSFRDDNIRVDHKWEDGQMRYLRDGEGRVVGTFDRSTNKVKLYRGASAATLVHELGGHATLRFAEQEAERGNRQLLDRINRTIDEAPQTLKDEIRSRYPGVDGTALRDEIWAALRERNSPAMEKAIKTLQGKAWYNRAWSAFRDAWKGLLARMGFNRADLSGIDKMSPEQFNDFLDRTMAEGKTLGRLERGNGEGQRAMLEPDTFRKISDVIKKYKEQGVKFSPFTESIVSMLQRGGKKVIDLPGFQPTQLIIESPAFSGSIQGQYDLDHSALKHNWESGRAYSGYYTWPEFDRAFRDYNLKNIIKLPNKHAGQETWQWTVKYPKTDSHDAYTLTWKLVRNTNTGKMENLFTTREQKDYPPTKIQTPEGVHFDTITSRDVAETSSSGVAARSIAKPEGESQGGAEKIRKSVTSAPAKGNPIDDVRPKGERLQEGAQDSDISIRNLQRDLGGVEDKQTESGHTDAKTTFNEDGTVKELGSTDVYSAKMRMNGHLQAGFNEIKAGQNTIDKTLADNGLTQAQFDKFLYASHAPERNQTIAERMAENANKAEWRKARAEAEKGNTAPLEALRRAVKVDTASKEYSGMSTDEANAYLASPEVASKRAALESAANELYKMERKNLDRLLESGRISKEFYDLLTTRWQKYVPLRTDVEGKDGAAYNLSVGGFRQNEFLTAEGRKTEADSPYTFAMLQVQQGLRGSEANTVHLTAANLVRKAEQQGYHIGDIIEGKEMGRGKGWTFQFADGDMVQVGGDMKLAKNRKDIILFKENGELKAIRLVKGANGRGEAVADAITGRNVQQWHKDLAFIPKWTRWLSAMRTQYSPEFIFSNALADHMESTQALIGRYGIKDGGKLAGQALVWEKRNLGDLRRYIKTGDAGNGYVKEAIDAGVLIKGGVAAHGYAGELKDIQSSYDRFVRDAKGFGNMTAKEKASFVWDGLKGFISHTNELIENSTRIGIYSALREKGVSKADAVKFAREATVDFNRKGGYTPWVNGLFMFSNASVQGAVRSVQAMKDTHGKELIGLLVAAGVAKAGLDYFLGNDEDREKEGGRNARNLSEYDKKHKLGIPIPGTSYQVTALRMRGPYAAIPYLAQTFTNVALGETKTADAAKTVVRELTDQATDLLSGNGVFNDKGEFDGALLGQSLAPTLADPLVQLYSGKDYKGDERKARAFDKTMPLSSNGKRNTPVPYKAAAEFINKITGGNENRKGLADIAPEDLQLVVEFLAGGVGRDIGNVVSTGQNIKEFATGGSPERTLSQTPFLRTLTNEYPENTSRYFDALDAYERDKAEFKKTTDIERRREMKKEKPYLFTGKSLLDGQIDKVKELTHLERGEVKSGNKWVVPKTPRSEAQKEKYREQRLRLQATILRQLKA